MFKVMLTIFSATLLIASTACGDAEREAAPSPTETPAATGDFQYSIPGVVATPPPGVTPVVIQSTPGAGGPQTFIIGTAVAGGPAQGSVFIGPSGSAGAALGDPLAGLAVFLGVSSQVLQEELQKQGATQATVAAKYGKTRDQLKRFVLDGMSTSLNNAVRAGTMSQAQATQLLAQFQSDVDRMIDSNISVAGTGSGPAVQITPRP